LNQKIGTLETRAKGKRQTDIDFVTYVSAFMFSPISICLWGLKGFPARHVTKRNHKRPKYRKKKENYKGKEQYIPKRLLFDHK
jgi:hypothetical protein